MTQNYSNSANPYYVEADLNDYPDLTASINSYAPYKKARSLTVPTIILNALTLGLDLNSAAKIAGISARSIYNWAENDELFASKIEQAKHIGIQTVAAVLWKKIVKDENMEAIKFYLSHRSEEFKDVKVAPQNVISEDSLKLILEQLANRGNLLPSPQQKLAVDETLSGDVNGHN